MRLEHLLSGEVALKSVTSVAGTRKVKKPTVNLRFVSRTPPGFLYYGHLFII